MLNGIKVVIFNDSGRWYMRLALKSATVEIPVAEPLIYYNLAHLIAIYDGDMLDLQAWLHGHYGS